MNGSIDVHCGIDIVEVSRFEKIVGDSNKSFIEKCFTEEEIRYCYSPVNVKKQAERFAARFAAKEAVGKALGTGVMCDGVGMRDIEVIMNEKGAPSARLTGGALAQAEKSGISSISLSLSHDGGMAAAYCVMLSEKQT